MQIERQKSNSDRFETGYLKTRAGRGQPGLRVEQDSDSQERPECAVPGRVRPAVGGGMRSSPWTWETRSLVIEIWLSKMV